MLWWQVLAVAAVLGATACQVTTDVAVVMTEDGSGTVSVSVGLDGDALARVPGIEAELRLDDLAATGWEITGPERDRQQDGETTRFVATKPFATPDEATTVMAEVSGPDGPFRDFRLTRDRSFATTAFGFDGTVDLGGGLESFGDDELALLLDGEPLGADERAIEAALGVPLDQAFRFRVTLELPGDGAAVVWEPSLADDEPTVLHARSSTRRLGTLVAVGLAAAATVALGVAAFSLVAARSRDRPAPRATRAGAAPTRGQAGP